ncbi:MAG: Replication factor C large subunit [Methanocella sp. PtaU1.Bin125]|nr:MAG: Replication factor C large subunit [Methanocella sp. PtaU1.Bin125]
MCPDHLDWTEKYRPQSLGDVVGNDAAVKALRQWAMTFGSGKRAVILHGSPGVGKTSAALALAGDMGWEYIEMNASDQRNKAIVQQIAGSAAKAGTFEGVAGRRLIVLDEADNLSGNQDRGGESAILNVIKTTDQPIILIANDLYALSKPLRDAALTIPFRAILSTSVARTLRRICAEEHIKCDPDALMKIAERTSDLRSAINDLQAAAQGKGEVTLADVATGERDVPETIFRVMDLIFRGKDMMEALKATYDLDMNPEDLIGWVDENLPREYKDDDLERGFEAASRADVYLGRVRRRMDYGMWRYAGFMQVCGVNRARRRRSGGYTKYSPPTYWKKLGWTKAARATRDSVAAKIGKACHASKKEARSSYMPMIQFLFEREDLAIRLSAELKLEEDEIAFLLGAKKASKKVGEIYKKSRELIVEEIEEDIDAFARFGKYGGPPAEGEPRKALIRAAGEEEEKPPAKKPEKLEAKPKRARRKARDGGEAAEPEPTAPEETPALQQLPEPPVETAITPEPDKKKQRTLFEF